MREPLRKLLLIGGASTLFLTMLSINLPAMYQPKGSPSSGQAGQYQKGVRRQMDPNKVILKVREQKKTSFWSKASKDRKDIVFEKIQMASGKKPQKVRSLHKKLAGYFVAELSQTPARGKGGGIAQLSSSQIKEEEFAVLNLCKKLEADPEIESCTPNLLYDVLIPPDDFYYNTDLGPSSVYSWGQDYPDMWGIKPDKVNVEEAWNTTTGEGVIVAVTDTGIDYTHPDIQENIWINPGELPDTFDSNGDGILAFQEVMSNILDYNGDGVKNLEDLFSAKNPYGDLNGDGYAGVAGVDDDGDGLIDEDSGVIGLRDDGTYEGFGPPRSRFLEDGVTPNPDWINDRSRDDDENGYEDDYLGYNFRENNNNPMDVMGHGTHVAGTIAAMANNLIGIAGVAPGAKVMALKIGGISQSDGGLALDASVKAILYAAEHGAKVINASWGRTGKATPLMVETIQAAKEINQTLFVAAAGNANTPASFSTPANVEGVVAVASLDQNDIRSNFSNYDGKVDVSAPGGGSTGLESDGPLGPDTFFLGRNILSLRARDSDMCYFLSDYALENGVEFSPGELAEKCVVGEDGLYYRARGTSFAAPHTAGVAALLYSVYPEMTTEEARLKLIVGSDPVDGLNPEFWGMLGGGRLNAPKALTTEIENVLKFREIRMQSDSPQKPLPVRMLPMAQCQRLRGQTSPARNWRKLHSLFL